AIPCVRRFGAHAASSGKALHRNSNLTTFLGDHGSRHGRARCFSESSSRQPGYSATPTETGRSRLGTAGSRDKREQSRTSPTPSAPAHRTTARAEIQPVGGRAHMPGAVGAACVVRAGTPVSLLFSTLRCWPCTSVSHARR